MDGGGRTPAPEGDSFPWGPPFQVFLAQLGASAGQRHLQGERRSSLMPELEVALAGQEVREREAPGEPRWEERNPAMCLAPNTSRSHVSRCCSHLKIVDEEAEAPRCEAAWEKATQPGCMYRG